MLRQWLAQPHIDGWWGAPDREIALFQRDLDGGPTDMRVVWADAPFAYLQDYPAHYWPAPQYESLPADTRAMGTFLGDPAYLGKGPGSAYLRQRATELSEAGASTIVVDPDPLNTRAIAAYTKAGFAPLEERPGEAGNPALVMTFSPDPKP